MRPTDFAKHLTEFLSVYLPAQKNASKNTIKAYRDTFKLLLQYCDSQLNIPAEKLTMGALNHRLVTDFLAWLEAERRCSISTRNQRLAALHSFFRYAQYEEPAGLKDFQKVISIPVKKAPKPTVPFLTSDAMQSLLSQPDQSTPKGRRDLTLLAVLYDSACRVQELIDLRVCDVILTNPAVLILTGKGGKTRRVPHMFRHSKSIHLLQAGVNLIYIRDFLGHEDIQTTEIYAKCDTELKRKAIENAYPELVSSLLDDWSQNANLLDWLFSLK